MRVDENRALLARVLGTFAIVFSSFCLLAAPTVFAQEDGDSLDDPVEVEDEAVEEVVVTGSRLKRSTYSSISPLQIISGQVSREVGLIDAADILQSSTASSGQQIDLTFSGFVLDNGPGATTVNLRGLGEARTLVLVNGRRLAPAGVEGAPFAPDLNLVPASLVQQYDLLLDGASSVYGSDAIAGVANIILRKDFDGLEIESYSRVPEYSSGVDHTLSVVWGKNFDRGFIGVGAEYVDSEEVTYADRPWTAGCERPAEIDENGQIRSTFLADNFDFGMDIRDGCNRGNLAGRIIDPINGSIYYTPGQSNGGYGDWSESTLFGLGLDGDGDGVTDVTFRDYGINGRDTFASLFPEVTTQNYMAYGEYTFDSEANLTPFFEVSYAKREFFSDSGAFQLFPVVPSGNPFNPCNPNQPNGFDCGDANDALVSNPNIVQQFLNTFGCSPIDPDPVLGCDQRTGPIGPQNVQIVASVRGDRTRTDVTADQLRFVTGLRGDMPFLTMGSLDNWSFEVSASLSKSTGESSRVGVRDDRLDLSQGWFSTTNTPCENDTGAVLEADVAPGCIPVNLFAPSLYDGIVGDFATQAERDYLFDSRDFDTEYEQSVYTGYITGDIFELPAGAVAFGFGAEFRNDKIDSIPDAVARDGLFFGFFADGGAVGEKDTKEWFAEIELPLLAGTPAFEELTLNISTRYTDDEFYGSDETESFKLAWRPVESLLIRGTFGTSFRAPNLRELFLASQSGFLNLFDPCLIPDDALDPMGNYVPALDDREPEVFTNCLANGVDPRVAQNNGFNTYSIEVPRGGSSTLNAETSEAWSAGIAWDVPFTNAFDLSIGATYYEIDVKNTIIEPGAQFVINDCYENTLGSSAFCSRISRDFSDPTSPLIQNIDLGFLNRDKEQARGVDINIAFEDTFTVFERPIDFTFDLRANRQLERSTLFIDEDGVATFDTFQGEWGFPEWTTQAFFRFDYDDFRFTWETQYMSSVSQDLDNVDDFDDVTGGSDACLGPTGGDVLCRDIGFTDNYFLQNASVYYYGDRWTIGGGVRNLLNEKPPIVDGDETDITSLNNTPIGYGYDLNGRVYFLNIGIDFGGSE